MATGIDVSTRLLISGVPEIRQRINRLFSTRKNTLVLRRSYGSDLPDLLDKKTTPQWVIDLYAETANALADPANGLSDEISLERVYLRNSVNELMAGKVELALEVEMLLNGERVLIDGVQIQ